VRKLGPTEKDAQQPRGYLRPEPEVQATIPDLRGTVAATEPPPLPSEIVRLQKCLSHCSQLDKGEKVGLDFRAEAFILPLSSKPFPKRSVAMDDTPGYAFTILGSVQRGQTLISTCIWTRLWF
jgi:hypothetical protein